MTRPGKGGFTLIEILVVAVLGSLLILSAYQVLRITQQSYTAIHNKVTDQNSLRAGADVLFSELREISPTGGDLLAIGTDAITIRAMRRTGYACVVNYSVSPIELTTKKIGYGFRSGDSVFVFADNDIEIAGDDTWLPGRVTSMNSSTTCPNGDTAERFRVEGLPSSDSVRLGATIRSFRKFTYGIYQVDGTYYLAQVGSDGVVQPMVGPLKSPLEGGLEFEYFDPDGNTTSVPADVASIKVTLRTPTFVRTSRGEFIADSLTTRVALRN